MKFKVFYRIIDEGYIEVDADSESDSMKKGYDFLSKKNKNVNIIDAVKVK